MMNRLRRIGRVRLLDLGALALALIITLKITLVLPQRSVQNDFAHYYISSRLYVEGRNPYATPMQPLYEHYGFHLHPNLTKGSNPPLLLLFFAPFTLLPPALAFSFWVIVQVASLVVILNLTRQLLGDRISLRGFRFLCMAVLGSGAVYTHFFYSQVQLQLAAMTLAAFAWLRSGKSIAACSAAMLAALVKLYPLALVPWFVWHGGKDVRSRLKLAALCLGLAGVVVAATGLETWQEFLQGTPELFRWWIINRSFNYTVPSFVINLFSSIHGFAPAPELAQWIYKIAMGCGLAILATAYVMCWRTCHEKYREYREKEFGLLCIAMLASSLIAWGHYLVFLIFPFAVAVVQVRAKPSSWRVFGLVAVWLFFNCVVAMESPFLNEHLVLKVIVNYLPLYGILGLGIFFGKKLRQPAGGG